ncbi:MULTISPECIES: hypothetical protein [Streptomyces]|uniref:hypothetical protein n=1 Tax=Streptomyces TaxID=1883 RepID=UPI0029A66ACA|nr:hypothetical protein [Streptomyces sp. ME02-6978.2a]MDX3360583.1 hypothetical protein [Streptomyces sp. ME02-6978.2a]
MTINTEDDDLLSRLPRLSPQETLAELEAARRAEQDRPRVRTIIPEPELPPMWPHPDSGTVRFPCALGPSACLWAYEHDAYEDDAEPLSVPLTAGSAEIGRLFAERAARRSARLRQRVERAIRSHFAEAHPGQEPPEREVGW